MPDTKLIMKMIVIEILSFTFLSYIFVICNVDDNISRFGRSFGYISQIYCFNTNGLKQIRNNILILNMYNYVQKLCTNQYEYMFKVHKIEHIIQMHFDVLLYDNINYTDKIFKLHLKTMKK